MVTHCPLERIVHKVKLSKSIDRLNGIRNFNGLFPYSLGFDNLDETDTLLEFPNEKKAEIMTDEIDDEDVFSSGLYGSDEFEDEEDEFDSDLDDDEDDEFDDDLDEDEYFDSDDGNFDDDEDEFDDDDDEFDDDEDY